MVAYGLCIPPPLICHLKSILHMNDQPWYVNDAAIIATWTIIVYYFNALMEHSPRFEFYLDFQKSILVVPKGYEEATTRFFAAYQFKIVTGTRYLGDFVGSKYRKKKIA